MLVLNMEQKACRILRRIIDSKCHLLSLAHVSYVFLKKSFKTLFVILFDLPRLAGE